MISPNPVNGEVTIVCLTDMVNIPDLGLRLTRGAKVEVPLSAAMKSRDLSAAKMNGTVFTQTLRASAIRAQEMVSSDTTTSQSPRSQASSSVDLTPLLLAIQMLTEEVRAMRSELSTRPVLVPSVDLSPLVSQLKAVLSAPPVTTAPGGVGSTPPEVPFVPDGLIGKDLRTNLSVSSENKDGTEVVSATAALKSARKRR